MPRTRPGDLALALAGAHTRLERSLDAQLSATRGISFAEYRILRALRDAPEDSLARVELARSVGFTPSGITRALKPLEKIGMIRTTVSERDARLSLAELTRAGRQVVTDSTEVIEDVVLSITGGRQRATLEDLVNALLEA